MRRSARAADWGGPENHYPIFRIAGSNPASSAIIFMFQFFKKKKKEPANLKEVLEYLRKLTEDHQEISRELTDFKKESRKNLQKVGVVRFNPFKEVGGDQSFSIAVFDADNNGFVITSLYSHEASRVYAKPIKNGASLYALSKEEQEALNKAMGK